MKPILLFILCLPIYLSAQWTDLNTGINDNLTGIAFYGNNGVVSGHKGIYYTTNGGVGSTSWTRFNITGNSIDSSLYNNTSFTSCIGDYQYATNVYACGQDTVNQRAVIFKFVMPAMTYEVYFIGNPGTKLIDIKQSQSWGLYASVGDNGLIVHFTSTQPGTVQTTDISKDIKTIAIRSNNYVLGTEDGLIYGSDGYEMSDFSYIDSSLTPLNAAYFHTYTSAYLGGEHMYRLQAGVLLYEHQNYDIEDFGPLNVTSLVAKNNRFIIGTNHGIYRSVNSYDALFEYFPTSNGLNVSKLWMFNSTSPIYACGVNGTVLMTTNDGGASRPYAKFGWSGGCDGNPVQLTSTTVGTSNNYWYSDNVYIGSGASFSASGLSPGAHTITLHANNGTYTDTVAKTIYLVDKPSDNISINFLDSVICKSGTVRAEIDPAELNVGYTWYNTGGGLVSTNTSFNGSVATIESTILTESTNLYIRAKNLLNPSCYTNILDTISILIEHPSASMHVGLINADLNESVPYYSTSQNSDHLEWEFKTTGVIQTSTQLKPAVSFADSGRVNVKLKVWTNLGCYDSIQKFAPFVTPFSNLTDTNWIYSNHANTNPTSSYGEYELFDMHDTGNGYIISGLVYDTTVFASLAGDSTVVIDKGYIAKSDYSGILRWSVDMPGVFVAKSVTDSLQNVYSITRDVQNATYNFGRDFFANTGDTLHATFTPNTGMFIDYVTKLDSVGKLVWWMGLAGGRPMNITTDHNGDIYLQLHDDDRHNNNVPYSFIFLNGILTDSIPLLFDNTGNGIVKLNADGELLWHTHLYNTLNGLTAMHTDLHITSNNELIVPIYAQYISNLQVRDGIGQNYSYNPVNLDGTYYDRTYILRLNVNGGLVWGTYFNGANPRVVGTSLDENDNLYFSGRVTPLQTSAPRRIEFLSSNGSSFIEVPPLQSTGSYFAKYDKNGIFQFVKYLIDYKHSGIIKYNNGELYMVLAEGNGQFHFNFIGDSTGITFNNVSTGMCFTIIDTLGMLQRVLHEGQDPNNFYHLYNPSMFFQGDAIYYAMNYRSYLLGAQSLTHFSKLFPANENYSSLVERITPTNGVTYITHPYIFIDSTICVGSYYDFPDGVSEQMNTLGIFQDTVVLQAQNGQDSTILTHLLVKDLPHTAHNEYHCPNTIVNLPDGNSYFLVKDTIITVTINVPNRCDSLVTKRLYTFESDTLFEDKSICSGDDITFADGYQELNVIQNFQYISHINSVQGCDSIIVSNVVLLNSGLVPSITYLPNVNYIRASQSYPSYQWIDCSTNQEIPGAVNLFFYPPGDGFYAVRVPDGNGCFATSDCINYTAPVSVGLEELNEQFNSLILVPNPNASNFSVLGNELIGCTLLEIVDVQGRKIYSQTLNQVNEFKFNEYLEDGTYFVRCYTEDKLKKSLRLIVVN